MKQGSNFFWFEGQGGGVRPRGFIALEGSSVACRTVVNRTGEKPFALTITLPPEAAEGGASRPHLTVAAVSEELQVGAPTCVRCAVPGWCESGGRRAVAASFHCKGVSMCPVPRAGSAPLLECGDAESCCTRNQGAGCCYPG